MDPSGIASPREQAPSPDRRPAGGPGWQPPIHALFLERYAGDDALLKLAGLRFRQQGLAAELYADTPDQLDRVLPYLAHWPDAPWGFLEYAAWLEPGWFAEVAERLKDADRISCCLDIGHIGVRQAYARSDRFTFLMRLPVPLSHQGRDLFAHWEDLASAERMNYWLSVLAQNAILVREAIPA